MSKKLTILLSSLLIVLLTTEGLLRLFDPWGALRYFADLGIITDSLRESARGYEMTPGFYKFSNWQAVILPDATRWVPDTSPDTRCSLALVGDSVTFGHGVSDADTWANLLARQLPGAHVINAGVNGYAAENVLLSIRRVPAQAYLYLLINNDDDLPMPWRAMQQPRQPQSAMTQYLYAATVSRAFAPGPYDRFQEQFEAILAQPRVTVVTFADVGGISARALQDYPAVQGIPNYTAWNSRADGHADARGNAQIAAAMLPIVRAAIQRQCPAEASHAD